jgi:GTPase SAR1 family protein
VKPVNVVFILGTAGSGKSLLTSAFAEWLKNAKQNAAIVNLDPGVLELPYRPDLDVRNYVSIEAIMKEHHLGPNGAVVAAADLIAEQVENLTSEIEETGADIVLVDTPGQMELFAFRASGPYIASYMTQAQKAVIYLFDSVFSSNPLNFVSNLFLSAAVFNRFLLPFIPVLSKIDLLPDQTVEQIINWSEDSGTLEREIDAKLKSAERLLSREIAGSISNLGLMHPLIPFSAKTNEGTINLNIALERIFTSGDKYTF